MREKNKKEKRSKVPTKLEKEEKNENKNELIFGFCKKSQIKV